MRRDPRPRTMAPRVLQLVAGVWLFGTGEACLVHVSLGNSPWTVLAQGAASQLAVNVGATTIAISFLVLALWIPLHQRLGPGTLVNAVVIGLAIAVMLPLMPAVHGLAARFLWVLGGIGLVSIGSGLYLTCHLGPGPRDGLMTGLALRTGRRLGSVRMGLESVVVVAGFLLGGTVGIGTLAFALLIGPGVHLCIHLAGGLEPAGART